MTNATEQFGVHLLFDGYSANPILLSDKTHLKNILVELPKEMNMNTISEEVVVEVGQLNEKDPGGLSGFVMIAESHISFHTFPARGFVTADIYTCQNEIDSTKYEQYLAEAFGTDDYDCKTFPRGIRYPSANKN